MMSDRKFDAAADLGDYIEVKDRIARFYELYGGGRLVTGEVRLTTEPDGKPRVMVQALAYRTADDPQPGVGWSWMELPGATRFTKGSELENTETSAWGRAIAALGILVDRSVASAQEVRNKESAPAAIPPPDHPDGLIGTAEAGKGDADFELRQTPDGYRIGFRLMSGRGGIKAEAFGDLAAEIATYRGQIEGQRVTAGGRVVDQTFTPKGSTRPVTYQVLTLDRLQVPGLGTLPLPVEAETQPLFTAEEESRLDAALEGKP